MAVTVISNLKRLVGTREETGVLKGEELSELPSIQDAYLVIEDDQIAGFGEMKNLKRRSGNGTAEIGANWKVCFAHLV